MNVTKKDVIELIFEFIITAIILIGAGILLYVFKDTRSFEAILGLVAGVIGSVSTFWFQRRPNGTRNTTNGGDGQ